MWTHRDIVSDVFSLDDLFDCLEYLSVKEENEEKARDWQERQRQR